MNLRWGRDPFWSMTPFKDGVVTPVFWVTPQATCTHSRLQSSGLRSDRSARGELARAADSDRDRLRDR